MRDPLSPETAMAEKSGAAPADQARSRILNRKVISSAVRSPATITFQTFIRSAGLINAAHQLARQAKVVEDLLLPLLWQPAGCAA